jgi:hypothetical protein
MRSSRAWPLVAVVIAISIAGCQAASRRDDSATGEATTASPSSSSSSQLLPYGCSEDHPCQFKADTYSLGSQQIIPGMRLTLPEGWSSTEDDEGELNLIPPDSRDDKVFFWVDMVPVKSAGPGHGTPLTDVETNPDALVAWLTNNPDFKIVTPPGSVTVGGTPMTTLTVKVSDTADYGDPDCPWNPRCADFFIRPGLWPFAYGIGGDTADMFYLGTVSLDDGPHTVIIALDSLDQERLNHLSSAAQTIIDSVRFPA